MRYIPAFVLLILCVACNNNSDYPANDPEVKGTYSGIPAPANLNYTVLAQHPHDTSAFTQGLQFYNGKLFEGTGDYENSSLRITNYKTGEVEKKHMMGTNEVFGEGINIFRNKLYQLTWESNIVYVYELPDIEKPIKTFHWPNQGWGITNNGTDLIISDGTANLYFVDPETFKIKNTIAVVSNSGTVPNLNELEFINGYIYANVYLTYDIIKIDPESGHVVGKMAFNNLLQEKDKTSRTDVLNGIAYDSTSNTMLITGKRWPKLFEIKLN